MPHRSSHIDDRIRTWTLQRELVRASLASTARGHVLAPSRPRASAPSAGARLRKRG
jgi:hypothetical protein